MKKYKIIKLTKLSQDYKDKNLNLSDIGILISEEKELANVLFFNQQNIGDYALIQVQTQDIEMVDMLPAELNNKIEKFRTEKSLEISSHKNLVKPKLKEFDYVELVSDDKKYSEFGVKAGDRGVVANDKIIKNKVLVDFTGVTKTGEVFGDIVLVDIEDLQKLD